MQSNRCRKGNDDLQSYLRRDLLEIHGVPMSEDEKTDEIVLKVAKLIVLDLVLNVNDISISHRLPAAMGRVPVIIAKFVRRSVRDRFFTVSENSTIRPPKIWVFMKTRGFLLMKV